MKRARNSFTLIMILGVLLLASATAFATGNSYQITEVLPASWDGTDASRLKAASPDYDFIYGDDSILTYNLPWGFSYYGQSYTHISVDTNGNVWFANSTSSSSFDLVSTGKGPVISAWHNDLSSQYYGGVFIQHKTNPERVVIEWQVETFTDEGSSLLNKFEVIIFQNGTIQNDYKSFSPTSDIDLVSGFSEGDGTDALNLTSIYGNVFTLSNKSYLSAVDTTTPTGTITINAGAVATNSTAATLTLICSDAGGCSQMQFSSDNSTWSTAEAYAASKAWTLTTGDGTKTVHAKFKDVAGNWMTTSVNDTIILDTAVPATTASPVGGTYTSAQSVTLTCGDGTGSGCDKIYYTTNGTTPTTASNAYAAPLTVSSTSTLKYFATDKAGNPEAVKSQAYIINIDTTPPTGTVNINAGAAATNSMTATLTLTCSDAGGCSQMQFSNDNSTWSTAEAYATSKAWPLSTGDGAKTVYAKYKDVAGNWMTTAVSDTIILDTAVPTTSAAPVGGTYTAAQSVTLTCGDGDGTGSGCDKIYYTTNGTTPTTTSSVYASPLIISATSTLKYFATDKAGNPEAVKSQAYTINIDNMALALSINHITADYQGNMGITASNMSQTGSEVLIEQFVDANHNDQVDAGDYIIRSFKLSDGVISGDSNVQGDEDGAANSAISTTLNYFMQNDLYHAPGHYIFRASKAATAIFSVSPILQPYTISGTVTDGTNPLPGAMVRLLDKWRRHLTFAIADEYGNYSIPLKNAGQFYVIPYAYGYAARNDIPLTNVASGQTISGHNITLYKGDNHLYGKLTNTAGSSGIDGLWIIGRSSDYTGIAISDQNGNFDLALPAGQYKISVSLDIVAPNPSAKGYLSFQRGVDGVTLPGHSGRVEFKLPPPDVFVTGKVTDSAGNPLGGVPIEAREQIYDSQQRTIENNEPLGRAISDSAGNYSLGLKNSDKWGMGISQNYEGYTGEFKYPFSTLTDPLSGNNLTAQKVTAWIEGSLKNMQDAPIKDAEMKVQKIINSVNSRISTPKTAIDGTFRFGVFAGNWDLEFLSSSDVLITAPLQHLTVVDAETKILNVSVDSRIPLVTMNQLSPVTNKTEEIISGVRAEGVTVSGYNQSSQFMAVYPTANTWSGSLTMPQQEGINTIKVYGWDVNGVSDLAIKNIYVDPLRPIVTITSPAANSVYPSAPSLKFSVSDQNPVNVIVKVDGKIVQNYYGDTLNLSAGNHTVLVEATDIAGNTGFSSVGFTIGIPRVQMNTKENFETGDFSLLPWILSGDGMWSVVAGIGVNQTKGAVSPASLRDGESAVLETTYKCVTSGTLSYKIGLASPTVSDPSAVQPFGFYIDGVLTKPSGTNYFATYNYVFYPITSGIHNFKWKFNKVHAYGYTGKAEAWIDEILLACNNTKKVK